MSDLLPYEQQLQQQWTDVPLPDEQAAWEDMRRRLEEDKDRGFFYWWRPGCGLLALLVVVLLTGLGWWRWRNQPEPLPDTPNAGSQLTAPLATVAQDDPADRQQHTGFNRQGPAHTTNKRPKPARDPITSGDSPPTPAAMDNARPGVALQEELAEPPATLAPTNKPVNTPTNQPTNTSSITPADSAAPGTVDTPLLSRPRKLLKTDSTAAQTPKPDSSRQRLFSFSTGLGLWQQLPVAGQRAHPYNAQGRKSSLADYIPAVYTRLHYRDKWFLQAEFRYGAPQNTREFLYHQVTLPDTMVNPVTTTRTTARLKRTFYHQLPVSLHLQVAPGWTVGVGAVWNRFYAALSDQETIRRNNITQTEEVLTKGLVSIKADTTGSFARSYFQAVLETQYQWKWLSVGARYAAGLQPYIRFTLPGGQPTEEKNSSLQLFLRFQLWRSKQAD